MISPTSHHQPNENVQIGNVSPWQYLENETTKQMRKAHFIPENESFGSLKILASSLICGEGSGEGHNSAIQALN